MGDIEKFNGKGKAALHSWSSVVSYASQSQKGILTQTWWSRKKSEAENDVSDSIFESGISSGGKLIKNCLIQVFDGFVKSHFFAIYGHLTYW